MVNENQIPKTEMVYELKEKYEVPSFEEFMKTYEYDDKVNYDDLSGGGLSEMKGYGPCSYSNSKCICYINSGYIPLNSACPSCTYAPNTKHQWYHSWCGGQMYISTSAHIKCMSCSKEMKWKEWLFRCDHVEHKTYEQATNAQLFISALNIASSMHADDPRVLQMIAEISYAILKDSLNK